MAGSGDGALFDGVDAGEAAAAGLDHVGDEAGELEFKIGRARGRVPLSGRSFETSQKIPRQVAEEPWSGARKNRIAYWVFTEALWSGVSSLPRA